MLLRPLTTTNAPPNAPPTQTVSVIPPPPPKLNGPSSSLPPLPFSTPLEEQLYKQIRTLGPLSYHDYTLISLQHSAGYYSSASEIGSDFVTSPELLQPFSQLLAMFCLTLRASSIDRLVELGPGNGTLTLDFLNACEQVGRRVGEVWLVERSEGLRSAQREALRAEPVDVDEGGAADLPEKYVTPAGTIIQWVDDLDSVPQGGCEAVIMHEFVDALPAHVFEFRKGKWRERVVDIRRAEGGGECKKGAGGGGGKKPREQAYEGVKDLGLDDASSGCGSNGEGNLVLKLSAGATPAARVLLRKDKAKDGEEDVNLIEGSEGQVVEIQPAALSLAQDLGRR